MLDSMLGPTPSPVHVHSRCKEAGEPDLSFPFSHTNSTGFHAPCTAQCARTSELCRLLQPIVMADSDAIIVRLPTRWSMGTLGRQCETLSTSQGGKGSR